MKSQWKDEISTGTLNFRYTGLSRVMYEYQCCGVTNGCEDFTSYNDTIWTNATAASGCYTSNCLKGCSTYMGNIKTTLLFHFVNTLIALILTVLAFLCALSMASQIATFSNGASMTCCTPAPAEPALEE